MMRFSPYVVAISTTTYFLFCLLVHIPCLQGSWIFGLPLFLAYQCDYTKPGRVSSISRVGRFYTVTKEFIDSLGL